MSKAFGIALLLLMSGATCFAQSSYKGLTPGTSTRADVERVLGQPVKNVSKTLVEYKSPEDDVRRLYIQYGDEGVGATVLRIELVCPAGTDSDYKRWPGCSNFFEGSGARKISYIFEALPPDAQLVGKHIYFYGSPVYIVHTRYLDKNTELFQLRVAIYSRELYEAAAPK